MAQLKVDRIVDAYSRLRISGLTVIPNPSDLELALNRLESMMAQYASRGIEIGYNFEEEPDPNSDLNVPIQFWDMISTNLATKLVPDFNKDAAPALFAEASQSLSQASAVCARNKIRQVQYPARQPVGSGNRVYARWQRFYADQPGIAPNLPETLSIMQGETNDFREPFTAYLREDEAIISFTVVCDNGLVVVSSALDGTVIDYRLSCPVDLDTSLWQQVKITVTTDLGRVEIRIINFQIFPNVVVGNS